MAFPNQRFSAFLHRNLEELMAISNDRYDYEQYLKLCRITIALIKMTSSDHLTGETITQMLEERYTNRLQEDFRDIVAIKKKNSKTILLAFIWPETTAAIEKIRKLKKTLLDRVDIFHNKFVFVAKRRSLSVNKKPMDGTEAMLKVMTDFLKPEIGFEEIFAML